VRASGRGRRSAPGPGMPPSAHQAVMEAEEVKTPVELTAQLGQQADHGSGLLDPSPSPRGTVQHSPAQRGAGGLAGQPADHLHPPAGLAEGALDQIRVPGARPIGLGQAQVGEQGVLVVLEAGDCCGVELGPGVAKALARQRAWLTAASPGGASRPRRWPRSPASPGHLHGRGPWPICCGHGGSNSVGARRWKRQSRWH
jgi:hypothetical protein